jgi:hypothetical protein
MSSVCGGTCCARGPRGYQGAQGAQRTLDSRRNQVEVAILNTTKQLSFSD